MGKTIKGYGVVEAFKKFGKLEAPAPVCGPYDAIGEPVALAACTSDPHQVHAGVPAGMILGHEVAARLIEVGSFVKDFRVGDIVAVGAVTPDWLTIEVQDNIHQHAGGQAAAMNWCVTENGTFAEQFRIRQVDMNAAHIPEGLNYEDAILAADMMTTGFHGAELAHIEFGDVVVACGIGAVGQMVVAAAALRGAARIIGIGSRPKTKELAKIYGATDIVDYKDGNIDEMVKELLGGKQPDSVIFSGGNQDTWARCLNMVKPNGYVTNLMGQDFDTVIPGAYTYSWCAHKHINGGLCPGGRRRMERMMSLIKTKRVDPKLEVTHRFHGFEHIMDAYELMDNKTADVIKPIVYID